MQPRRAAQLLRLAAGLPGYLARPLSLRRAADAIRQRLRHREAVFLATAQRLIFDQPHSPHRRLLDWAGCRFADLRDSVRRHGLEATLESLRDAGVYLTLEEFRGSTPLCRPGLTIEPDQLRFDNPMLSGGSIAGTSSGSRSAGTQVHYTWAFLEEEAAHERLLLEAHSLSAAPLGFWMPGPPGIAGLHNLLLHLKSGRPPAVWFSQVPAPAASAGFLALGFIAAVSRLRMRSAPWPRLLPLEQAVKAARWLAQTGGVLKTYASSAIRLARAAQEQGIDLTGRVIFTGGEPLTAERHQYLAERGIRAFPRYAATESGILAGACPHRSSHDEMHFYHDRLALVTRGRPNPLGGPPLDSFLITSLSSHAPKVLFNTDLGDFGRVSQRDCPCLFGQLGLSVMVENVRSHAKLTGEGMTLLGSSLEAVIAPLIVRAGGTPDDFQFWESADAAGLPQLVVAIDPAVCGLDEGTFVRQVLTGLERVECGGALAAQFWRQAGTLRVVRARPQVSRGHKQLPLVSKERVA